MTRRFHWNTLLAVFIPLALLLGCADPAPHDAATDSLSAARLNEVQFIGSHNSYKRAVQPELYRAIRAVAGSGGGGPNVESIDYSHVSITDQLNLGLRNLELDVCHDPDGGRYATPLGHRVLQQTGATPWDDGMAADLATPGFKLLHDPDFDYRTWHVALEGALAEMRRWSEANPDHAPVIVTMNCKHGKAKWPDAVELGAFDAQALRALDATLVQTLGTEHLLRPDDIRASHPTLREGVLAHGWPTLQAAAGRFLFVLDETGQPRTTYLETFPGLRGATFFVNVGQDHPEAAIMIMNEPVEQEAEIAALVKSGFLVRTRADANTREARRNDFSRFDAAKRSGAQIITTDYYIADRKISDRYFVRFDDGSLMRENPVTGMDTAR